MRMPCDLSGIIIYSIIRMWLARGQKTRSTFSSTVSSRYAARPNKAINSGRIVASLVEWHLVGIAQPLAITMNEGVCLAVEVDPHHIQRRLDTGYCDEMASTLDEALHQVREACNQGQPLSIGLIGNAAEVYPELVRRGIVPDLVTDQTDRKSVVEGKSV